MQNLTLFVGLGMNREAGTIGAGTLNFAGNVQFDEEAWGAVQALLPKDNESDTQFYFGYHVENNTVGVVASPMAHSDVEFFGNGPWLMSDPISLSAVAVQERQIKISDAFSDLITDICENQEGDLPFCLKQLTPGALLLELTEQNQ